MAASMFSPAVPSSRVVAAAVTGLALFATCQPPEATAPSPPPPVLPAPTIASNAPATDRTATHREATAHVVLVSIDGLRADYCTQPDTHSLLIPNLRGLMGRGRIALGLTGPFPTVTYTAHTSLVTGASPDRHGILANRPFDPKYENQAGWYWYAESIKAETLWDAARAAGKTTGAVYWPVTVGARIDDNFPQMWRAKVDEDDKLLRALMSPSLVAGYARDYPLLPAEHRTDHERGDAAEYLLRERKDDLTLVYFTDLDEAEHAHGPGSREALATLERIDAELGRVLRAIDAAGDTPRTTVFVVSDHGFLPVTTAVRPAAILKAAGLFDVNAAGAVTGWRAGVVVAGGLAAIYLKDPTDPALRGEVSAALASAAADPKYGIQKVYDAAEVAKTHGFAGASFAIEAKAGFVFAPGWGAPVVAPSSDKGAHGYPPEIAEMRACFIAAGAGVRPGPPLPVIPMLSVAPTIARVLGLTLRDAEADPLVDLIETR